MANMGLRNILGLRDVLIAVEPGYYNFFSAPVLLIKRRSVHEGVLCKV